MELERYGVVELTSTELQSVTGGNWFTELIAFTGGMIMSGWEKLGEWECAIIGGILDAWGFSYLSDLFYSWAE